MTSDWTAPEGIRIASTVTLDGDFDEEQMARIRRTTGYCPVGKLFTKGVTTIEDQIVISGSSDDRTASDASPLVMFPPGSVHGRYLPDTQDWQDGVLANEGEVKVYYSCAHPDFWQGSLLAGHFGSNGWGPQPVDQAHAGLGASTVASLARLGADDVRVTITSPSAAGGGGRGGAQAAAEAGIARPGYIVRKVIVSGVQEKDVRAALDEEPIGRLFRQAVLAVEERIVIGTPTPQPEARR